MDYAIKVLTEKLESLDINYNKYVTKGKVKKESLIAKQNRARVKSIKKAIEKLTPEKDGYCICDFPLIRSNEKGGVYCGICQLNINENQ